MRTLCILLCLIALPCFGQQDGIIIPESAIKTHYATCVKIAALVWQDSDDGWMDERVMSYTNATVYTNEFKQVVTNQVRFIDWHKVGVLSLESMKHCTNAAGVKFRECDITEKQTAGVMKKIEPVLLDLWKKAGLKENDLKQDANAKDAAAIRAKYGVYRVEQKGPLGIEVTP